MIFGGFYGLDRNSIVLSEQSSCNSHEDVFWKFWPLVVTAECGEVTETKYLFEL